MIGQSNYKKRRKRRLILQYLRSKHNTSTDPTTPLEATTVPLSEPAPFTNLGDGSPQLAQLTQSIRSMIQRINALETRLSDVEKTRITS